MRIVFIFLIATFYIFADVHYAKLEPINTVTLKSEVSGKIVLAKDNLEGKVVNGLIVKVDDKLDKIDLQNSKTSLKIISKMIEINKNLLPALKKSLDKKRELYKKIVPVASSSENQKNALYLAFVSAKSQYVGTKEKILNLQNQKITLEQKIATLKDRISKKSFIINGKYLYNLYVREGDFVTIGMPIADVSDISRAKLIIYLSEDELKNIDTKKIYLNGKETNLKFSKIWKIADKIYISSYRAEIELEPKERFSKLVKVEVK